MVQAQYSQSNLSRQRLQEHLDAFQAQSSGSAGVAEAQRQSIVKAESIHFLQPHDAQVSLLAMSSLQGAPGLQLSQTRGCLDRTMLAEAAPSHLML